MKRWCQFAIRWGAVSAATVLSCSLAQPAHAASGAYDYGQVITFRTCPQVFVIADGTTFTIVEPVGGADVVDRDIVAGDLHYGGITTVTNTSRNNEQIKVIILDTLLSSSQYHARLVRYCNH